MVKMAAKEVLTHVLVALLISSVVLGFLCKYGKCSKISNTLFHSFLAKVLLFMQF